MAHKLGIQSPLLQLLASQRCCHAAYSPAAAMSIRLNSNRPRRSIHQGRFSTMRQLRDQENFPLREPPLPIPPAHPPATVPKKQPSTSFIEDGEPEESGMDKETPTLNSSSLSLSAPPSSETQLSAQVDEGVRIPRSVQAIYLRPLRRKAQYGLPVCDLQIRSYSVVNLEFMADFALRAAYYLHLPARGPVPLPRITERWTVPRGNFVHKKSQENFERITMRRLIQIQDGHPETVEIWLAFIRKHAYYGVGMKANVWEHEKLGVGKTMDVSLENLKKTLEPKWAHFGRRKNMDTSEKVYQMMASDAFRQTSDAPLSRL